MARTDELTCLANRRALGEEIRRELARSARLGHEVTVAMLDIDHFKDYNDRYRHPAGDELLREPLPRGGSRSARQTSSPATAERSSS